MLANNPSNMAIKSRKGQRRSREDTGGTRVSSSQDDSNDRLQRIAALKRGSKQSVSSESSGSKLSGTAGPDTEFDLDKHRDYDIKNSRRIYEKYESTQASSSLNDENLTDEERAWAGIDAILDDNQSVDNDNVLSEEIMAALHHSASSGRGEDDGEYDDDEDSDDSHNQAMKMFCGLKEGEEGQSDDLPGLMNSSFSSQFSQESARSVLSYLSKNNIIVQRDIQDGPLKSFLTEMAFSVERQGVVEEGDEEEEEEDERETQERQEIDFDDDETDIHLIFSDDEDEDEDEEEDERDSPVREPDREEVEPKQKEEGALDPIGQQIINAIMTELKRMKESDEYDEDDPNPVEEYEEEYLDDEQAHEEGEYYEEELEEEYEMEPETTTKVATKNESPRYPKTSFKPSTPKSEPTVDPRDLPEINAVGFVPEDDLNNSVPSLDTFQDDEVDKILVHQNPMAWASFGDLNFDSTQIAHERELPPTPFDAGEPGGQYSPVSPVRSVKDEIVSGIVGAPTVPQSPQSPPSPTKPKRRPNPKSPLKKKKKPVSPGGTDGGMRRSMVRPDGAPEEMRQSTATPRPKIPTATPKVLRKSVTRPGGAAPTPKVVRKSVKRPDGAGATPRLVRKSISRPDGTVSSPKTKRKSVSRQSTSRTPSLVKKSVVRQAPKRNPSSNRPGEGESDVRRSVRKAKPNPELGASQAGVRMSVVAEGESSAGTPKSPTKKKVIKGRVVAPSDEKKRRSVRKVRPPGPQ